MSISIKDTVQKVIGYILCIPGVMIFVIGIAMIISPNEGDSPKDGIAVAMVSLALILPGVYFIWRGRKGTEEEDFVESISAIVTTSRRITLLDLADKLDTSVPKARKALLRAISLKLVSGNFDRTTGEFFTEEGKKTRLEYKFCPACGAPFNRTFLEGETVQCSSCGSIIS